MKSEKHGMTGTSIFNRWQSMLQRCYYSKHRYFHRYGGRGITVCDKWRASFLAFYRDMGDPPTPHHQIDRINNNLGYFKENCRWTLPRENCTNRSSTKIPSRREVMALRSRGLKNPEIARQFGVSPHTIATLVWKERREKAS